MIFRQVWSSAKPVLWIWIRIHFPFVPPLLATLVDKTSTGVRATSMRTTVGTEWQSAHARSWTRDPLTTIIPEIRPESNSLPIIRNLLFNFRKFMNILLPVRDVNSILRNIQQKFFTMNLEGTDYRVSGYLCPKTPNSPAEETSSICLFCRSLLSMLGGRAFCNSWTPISLLKKRTGYWEMNTKIEASVPVFCLAKNSSLYI